MPEKLAVDDVDYFGTFGDADILQGVDEKGSSGSLNDAKLKTDESTFEV
jgi:hypothetical protein